MSSGILNEIKTLIWKEVTLEWRQKYALSGMLLYVISTVFVCYLSFNLRRNQLTPIVWNTLFWIIILFTAVNAIAKSFSQERYGRLLYYYSLCSPQSIIISKIIYNSLIMLLLSGMGFVFYSFVMGNAIGDMGLFVLCLFLAAIGFASVLTLVAGIASKADNSATLMAVLSFPIILPMLLMTIKLAKNAMDGLDWSVSTDEISTLLSIDLIVITLSYLLFPYLWRS
ncbi:heme exporter protein CcmB [Dyadobacter fanqingshengii]|uniref:Heme exporter protein CcmB n=1 Tax=Dyadobacter fanqingshengii TaxID=2906443 RepID=A0A9X1P7P2_9BACT|nr:heme exporter protein CcmB [Dyadobacter fanqingshengii]MCF0039565.1 heme exporter protein CcmB [Dyadobacter fanqingshengii]MCF2502895.1 heme exporter protein CcmB [Dyadobacter fanqingshengii]USJ38665.1 heme exporter protein CcmB [Dyadobacter fanqingshengii]